MSSESSTSFTNNANNTERKVNFLEEPEVIIRVSPTPSKESDLSISPRFRLEESSDEGRRSSPSQGCSEAEEELSDDQNTNVILNLRPPPTPIPHPILNPSIKNLILNSDSEEDPSILTPSFLAPRTPPRGRSSDRRLPLTDPVISKSSHHHQHRDLSVSGLKLLKERAEKRNSKTKYLRRRESFNGLEIVTPEKNESKSSEKVGANEETPKRMERWTERRALSLDDEPELSQGLGTNVNSCPEALINQFANLNISDDPKPNSSSVRKTPLKASLKKRAIPSKSSISSIPATNEANPVVNSNQKNSSNSAQEK